MNIKKKYFILIFTLLIFMTGCDSNKKCPSDYTLEDDICIKILETDAITTYENYCMTGRLINGRCYMYDNSYGTIPMTRKVVSCPYGYTTNKNGVPGLEVPQLEVPGVNQKCYKRVTTSPK